MSSRLIDAKGVWFFGLSGAGKTTASKEVAKKLQNPLVIDGDEVRRLVSTDLTFSEHDREIQIKRVLGFCKIVSSNGYFPIASTVYMNHSVLSLALENAFYVIQITRSMEQLKIIREIYHSSGADVVGMSIKEPDLATKTIHNCGTSMFFDRVAEL